MRFEASAPDGTRLSAADQGAGPVVLVGHSSAGEALIPRQVADLRAIDDLGNRLDAYRAVQLPAVLLGGSTSPAHLGARLDALEQVLPRTERVMLTGQGHGANAAAPAHVASVIRTFQHKLGA